MQQASTPLKPSAAANAGDILGRFGGNERLVSRSLGIREGGQVYILYISVLIDEAALNAKILRPLGDDLERRGGEGSASILNSLQTLASVRPLKDYEEAVALLFDAGVVVFADGQSLGLGFSLPGYDTRAIEEPKIETNVRGPRESLVENLNTNLSLVFRRLRTPDLKTASFRIGAQSGTEVILLYLQSRIDPELLKELERRIEAIRLEVLIDAQQIEGFIQDRVFSPFPQFVTTERPDRIAAALHRGRAAILVDGTPSSLIAPSTFFEMLHPIDDLYQRYFFTDFLRVLRMITLFISLFGPSLYIALTTFHLEMIPTPLMMTFIAAKSGIPLPTFGEALLMETAFEILREASLRLPRTVGQSVSIVGALIIGEAAVQSGIVSRPMVIVVAATGIASFTIPSFSLALSFRLLRFGFMLLAASFGVLGISIGALFLLLHLCSLHSCGVPFLEPIAPGALRMTLRKYLLLPIKYRAGGREEGGG